MLDEKASDAPQCSLVPARAVGASDARLAGVRGTCDAVRGQRTRRTTMKETRDKLRTEMQANLDQLRALRDEVKLRVHLGKMEAKQRWNELEPRVNSLFDQAEKSTAELSRAAVDETIHALEKLRSSI
jgi:hypothetical protein